MRLDGDVTDVKCEKVTKTFAIVLVKSMNIALAKVTNSMNSMNSNLSKTPLLRASVTDWTKLQACKVQGLSTESRKRGQGSI